MRAFTKSAIVAVAGTLACTMSLGVAAAQTSPLGSLGSLGSSAPGPEEPEEATPLVSLSKATGIAAAGETITVAGSGFSGAGAGIYVGLVQDDKYSATDSTAWMTTKWLEATDIVSGAWTADIDVAAIKGDSNCLENACSIYTVSAHGSPDRTQDTKTPVSFAPSVVVPTGPAVTASKTANIAAAGEDITISGTGFEGAAASTGLYVGVIQDNKWSPTDATAWGAQTFVRPSAISGGAWSTTLNIKAVQGGADCLANACSIYTVMAHGSADRSQDTTTPITFAAPAAGVVVDASEIRNVAGLQFDAG
ncbi:hypothetical protein ERC79_20750 [Rhodococcus sp. ABRD24]|uniref:hypothetical protein n=1 Tax=Rhodococcus sp. ABRD24 TaxID=2507582 RepID=UPI00104039EA|nr:hypothetical protein [Rhodococcus sp. ABRD24]QBJ98099.1 hypothetical protein ERC79_20750 [Rhodococcus sp. ABRD24]